MGMPSTPPRLDSGLIREILCVIALALVGFVIRIWSFGRLGLIHFDEGIYALAGLWVFSPGGLQGLDPTVIAYAPPGFPILVGLSYLGLGMADFSAILVSIVLGTLTIPAVGWVARRTFGAGAGAAAAAFAALSGPHIAFSRMALTDASFLLCWVLAIGQGQRFLERPKLRRAVLLGVTVGITQLLKYNGGISGVLVALGAALWLLLHPHEGPSKTTVATWGWGFCAAVIASSVYWPWFQFVESHGGYAKLWAHHQSYLGGISTWPGHLSVQLAEARALSGGPVWMAGTGFVAAVAMVTSAGDLGIERRLLLRVLAGAIVLALLCLIPHLGWWLGLYWIGMILVVRLRFLTKSVVLVVVGWVCLSVLTPFYHPYARLWLPLHAFGWVLLGGLFVLFRSGFEVAGRAAPWRVDRFRTDPLPLFAAICLFGILFQSFLANSPWKSQFPSFLGPRDSLRLACLTIAGELPREVKSLRLFARPAVQFYLGRNVSVQSQPDMEHLLGPGDPTAWALLDSALLPRGSQSSDEPNRSGGRWVRVGTALAPLDLPTLLDIDPGAALTTERDRSASLTLLRPKQPRDAR
jgi:4-amino-4-deoxy-L-arabinose transferase-like glycosyltransferase